MGAFANIGTSPHISCKSFQIIEYHLMIIQYYNVFYTTNVCYNTIMKIEYYSQILEVLLTYLANNRILPTLNPTQCFHLRRS